MWERGEEREGGGRDENCSSSTTSTTIRQYVRCVQMRAEIILHGSEPISSLVAYSNYAFSLLPRLFGHAFTIPPWSFTARYINYYPHHVIRFRLSSPLFPCPCVNYFAHSERTRFEIFFLSFSSSFIENYLQIFLT